MEDEHIRIDDLSAHMGSLYTFPEPSAFYGVNVFPAVSFHRLLNLLD